MITIVKHKYIKILNMTNTTNFLKVKSVEFSKFGFSFVCLLPF